LVVEAAASFSTLAGMAESADQIRKHIDVLSEFEQKYGEYISALGADFAAAEMPLGIQHEGEYEGAGWSSQEWTRRKREISMLAVRADLAMRASGVPRIRFAEAEFMDEDELSPDLPSQVFDFSEDAIYGDGL
jgi:hypothetical protein